MRRAAFLLLLVVLSALSRSDGLAQTPARTPAPHHYLFSYFKGNGEDGVHLAYSVDGLSWRALNGDRPFLTPAVGQEKLTRDPMVLRGPDGVFHMVWTPGWRERGIGHASSPDLIHWSEQQYIPVMAHEPRARNAWAPELAYDASSGEYLVFWATTIVGRFPATDGQLRKGRSWDPGWDHRIYYVATRDFRTFTPARLLYEHGFNVIDATMVRDGARWLMFVKDETDEPRTPQKNIHYAVTASPTGPWGPPSPAITGKYWAEGPTVLRIDGTWYVYFDKYMEGHFGLVTSPDLEHWTEASDRLSLPPGIRHGTAFEIPADVAAALLARDSASAATPSSR